MMVKPLRLLAFGVLAAADSGSHAFQSIQLSPRVLMLHAPRTKQLPCRKPTAFHASLRQSMDDDVHSTKNVEPISTPKAALNITAIKTFFLSLSIFLLQLFITQSASAVQSGGRMGGSFGGSSSRQSSSRSYSSPSRSYSSPSSTYSRGYSRGLSRGYYSRPNVIVAPNMGYRPWYSPWGYSPYYASPGGVVVTNSFNPFSTVFFLAGFFILATVLSNVGSNAADSFSTATSSSVLGPGVSVAEMSVALEVPDRDSPNSILSALSRLSRTARTDSRVGIQNLTSQVAIELLRRKSSIVAASTNASHYRDENKALREYNKKSIQQRSKFERETLSKFGGVDYSDSQSQTSTSDYKATVAVVTFVMLIDGDNTSKQLSSNINKIGDVERALSCIAADSKADDCLRSVELLWTPEDRGDTLTMRDVYVDYPSLRSII